MSYITSMEDDVVEQDDIDADDVDVYSDDTEHDEQEDGIISAMIGFEQQLADALAIKEVLYDVRGNNDAIVGVMAAMASMGIGGSVATLRGMEAADDPELSYYVATESADTAAAANAKGIFHTLESWKTNKLNWFKNAPTNSYAELAKWEHLINKASPQELELSAKAAKVISERKRISKWMGAMMDIQEHYNRESQDLGMMIRKIKDSGGVVPQDLIDREDIAHEKDLRARKAWANAHKNRLTPKTGQLHSILDKLETAKEARQSAYRNGWDIHGLKTTITDVKYQLQPTHLSKSINGTVKDVRYHIDDAIKNTVAKAAPAPVKTTGHVPSAVPSVAPAAPKATAIAIKPASLASRVMKFVSSHFRSWWVIAAAVAAAVIGVCVAIWRVYKKNNKEDAERLEREGDQIKEKALREAHAAYK